MEILGKIEWSWKNIVDELKLWFWGKPCVGIKLIGLLNWKER